MRWTSFVCISVTFKHIAKWNPPAQEHYLYVSIVFVAVLSSFSSFSTFLLKDLSLTHISYEQREKHNNYNDFSSIILIYKSMRFLKYLQFIPYHLFLYTRPRNIKYIKSRRCLLFMHVCSMKLFILC